MTLYTYMTTYSITLKEIEKLTGIDFRTISLYRRKLVIPSLKSAKKISKATKGKVGLKDWDV